MASCVTKGGQRTQVLTSACSEAPNRTWITKCALLSKGAIVAAGVAGIGTGQTRRSSFKGILTKRGNHALSTSRYGMLVLVSFNTLDLGRGSSSNKVVEQQDVKPYAKILEQALCTCRAHERERAGKIRSIAHEVEYLRTLEHCVSHLPEISKRESS
eukprot:6474346-Amphidinium_carterae.3